MTYRAAVLKRRVELIIMFPFVLLGKLAGKLFSLHSQHTIFLFFPSADIGGAPKVNADITQCIKDQKPVIIFSKKPKNNQFRNLFEIEGVKIIDLHKYIDNKLYHFVNFFFRGVLASWINKAENPVIFGGESLFFYKMLPHVKKGTRRIELCHLPTWLHYTIGYIDLINLRLFSTKNLKEKVIKQYNENHLDEKFYKKLYFIDNAIDIPPYHETHNEKLEVVFIGRGAPQKRIHLIAAMAKKMNEDKDGVHFSFVGDVKNVINTNDFSFCKFYGNVTDDALMQKIYSQSDALILTSAYEGLPIVVMKMMSYGKVVVSTAVNGIPYYIKNMENGLLITATDEEEIIKEGIEELRSLIQNPDLKQRLGKRSRDIAVEKFSEEKFAGTYRKILLDPNVSIVESE